MKSENSILLRKFNIAPLTGVEQTQFSRIDTDYIEQFNRIESLFTHATGGCLLVTGYRGVGKTTFINKVLHKASQELVEKNNTRLLTVHLNLARGYSTDKLLRRMVRELFFELDKNGIYDSMPENVKHQFLLAFLRTSNKMKQALSEGIKEAITKRTSQTNTRTNTYNLEPSVGIKDLSAALGSMEHSRQRSVTTETERTHENAWERGVELEFLEYDDEIAESDLSSLINILNWYTPSISEDTQPHRKYRRPEFFWKRMPTEYRILGKWLIRNYSETFSPTYKQQQFRVVFVLDEIDKMSLAQAEEIFRSLKNLFLQGNAFFVMIAGKDFYFHWRLNSTMEDDALFGLFTDVIHVPLFSDSEFKSMAESLVCTEGSPFPPELFTHLLYKAKGTPREFLRELTHFVSWDGDLLKLIGFDKGPVKLSQRLYPYIEKAYNQRIQEQQSIDTGMKDHLRRRLHNWLHAMVLKVVFTQEQILRIQSTRPQSQDNSASASYETLLADGRII